MCFELKNKYKRYILLILSNLIFTSKIATHSNLLSSVVKLLLYHCDVKAIMKLLLTIATIFKNCRMY